MIKDIPNCDKPREKALKYGVNNLSDSELIAIILRTGTVNYSVIDIAQNILRESNTINKLNQLSISKLSEIRGVGKVKAITLMAAIELGRRSYQTSENIPLKIKSAVVVFEYFKYIFLNQKQENFIVIFLDNHDQTRISVSFNHDIDKIKKDLNLKIVSEHNNSVKFINDLNSNKLINIISKYNINKLLIEEMTIEDLFMEYYK